MMQVRKRNYAWFTTNSMFMVEQFSDFFMFTFVNAITPRSFKNGQKISLKMNKAEVSTIIQALETYLIYGPNGFMNFCLMIDNKSQQYNGLTFYHQSNSGSTILTLTLYQNRLFFNARKGQINVTFPLLPNFICDIYRTIVALYNIMIYENVTVVNTPYGIS